MKTQIELEKFREKVEQLIRHRATGKRETDAAPAIYQHHQNHDTYQKIAANILKHLIEPRIELVADRLEDASIEVNADVGYVRLSFLSSRLSARFYLLFCLRLDHSARMVRLYAESCLRPYTKDYEPSGSLVIPLKSPDLKRAEAFIEDQILKFLKGYLRLRHEEKAEVMPP